MTATAIHVHPIVKKAQQSIISSAIQQMDKWVKMGGFDREEAFGLFFEKEFSHFQQPEYEKMHDMLSSHYLVLQACRKAEQLVSRELEKNVASKTCFSCGKPILSSRQSLAVDGDTICRKRDCINTYAQKILDDMFKKEG